jgi:diguanylate cyclase (GGDEF)-like protein
MTRDTEHNYQVARDTDHGLKAIDPGAVPGGRPLSANLSGGYLVHIYPTGRELAARYILGDTALVLGRSSDCDIVLNDEAASRRHAMIERRGDGYYVQDLNSTNGLSVNNVRVAQARLSDGDNLRIGNHIFRFLMGGNVEVDYHEEIYRLTIIDPLTEVHNKRYLTECLGRELSRSARYRRPLALVLLDVDHFKEINDTLGHVAGDLVLRELAACVKVVVRKDGLFARFGGEEFAVVLPETGLEGAGRAAERIRERIEQHAFVFEGRAVPVTISLGVTATDGGQALTPEEFIQLADQRLYQAKREGRNRVATEAAAAAVPAGKQTLPL